MSSVPEEGRNNTIRDGVGNENIRPSCSNRRGPGGGYLVYLSDGDVPFFRVSFSPIFS